MKRICFVLVLPFLLGSLETRVAASPAGNPSPNGTADNADPDRVAWNAAANRTVGYVGFTGSSGGYAHNVYRHYIYNNPKVVVPGAPIHSVSQPPGNATILRANANNGTDGRGGSTRTQVTSKKSS